MKSAFVTGATGFVGSHVVEQLVEGGWSVTALHRAQSNIARLKKLPVRLVVGSLEDPRTLELGMPEGCDAVFHLAGNLSFWSGDETEQRRVNVEGTRNLVAAALTRKAKRFVHTSSVSAYGGQAEIPFDESATSTASSSPVGYERTKYLGELEVKRGIDLGLDAVILNPGNIIGRYDLTGWARFFVLIDRGKLPGVPPAGGTFCDAEAVARAHVTAALQGASGGNYLLGGADSTYLEMVRRMGALLGKPVPKRTVPIAAFRAVGWLSQLASYATRKAPTVTPELGHMAGRGAAYFRSDKAVRELDYRPVSLDSMLEKSYRWLVDEGKLSRTGVE
jgi:nucleoside-diphosphate-sugar epimerase